MLSKRIPKADWAKAWRAMIEIAPVRLSADDPVYEVLPAHLDLWPRTASPSKSFSYDAQATECRINENCGRHCAPRFSVAILFFKRATCSSITSANS